LEYPKGTCSQKLAGALSDETDEVLRSGSAVKVAGLVG